MPWITSSARIRSLSGQRNSHSSLRRLAICWEATFRSGRTSGRQKLTCKTHQNELRVAFVDTIFAKTQLNRAEKTSWVRYHIISPEFTSNQSSPLLNHHIGPTFRVPSDLLLSFECHYYFTALTRDRDADTSQQRYLLYPWYGTILLLDHDL